MATLDTMVEQATIKYERKKRNEEYRVTGQLPPFPKIIVEEILPAETANKIINTIIEKEGEICSRELLYETQCIRHGKRGISSNFGLYGDVKYEYFSSILGIILTPDNLDQFGDFLKNHLSKSSKTKSYFYGFYCMMNFCPKKVYSGGNGFSLCILKKHKKYLKSHNLFDLDYYNYAEKHGSLKENKESLEAFIKRSDEIAAENKSKEEKKN